MKARLLILTVILAIATVTVSCTQQISDLQLPTL